MSYKVEISDLAFADLTEIEDWIVGQAGRDLAAGYVMRIRRRMMALAEFPHRGTPRPNWGDDFRTLSFEGRLLIAYRVRDDRVLVERVMSTRRDLSHLL